MGDYVLDGRDILAVISVIVLIALVLWRFCG